MAPREPATPPAATPPADGPEKIAPGTPAAGTPIVETASPTLDRRTGEPVSAEVRPEPVRRRRGPLDELRAEALAARSAGTLPAKGRVLAGGHVVEIGPEPDDTLTRGFTATIRILRGELLYEAGAPVPLTRTEFEAKRDSQAVSEEFWEDGLDVED